MFSKTCETGKVVAAPPEGFEQMQSLKFIDNNYTASGFPLQCLFSVGYATPKLFLLNIIFLLFNQQVKPSEMQGQVDTLFPEVILCVEIYNSRKVKVLHCSAFF